LTDEALNELDDDPFAYLFRFLGMKMANEFTRACGGAALAGYRLMLVANLRWRRKPAPPLWPTLPNISPTRVGDRVHVPIEPKRHKNARGAEYTQLKERWLKRKARTWVPRLIDAGCPPPRKLLLTERGFCFLWGWPDLGTLVRLLVFGGPRVVTLDEREHFDMNFLKEKLLKASHGWGDPEFRDGWELLIEE
jgi:hypothetical protein